MMLLADPIFESLLPLDSRLLSSAPTVLASLPQFHYGSSGLLLCLPWSFAAIL